jgi:hypothetical protein
MSFVTAQPEALAYSAASRVNHRPRPLMLRAQK